jgi:ribosomal protein L37E
VSVSATEQRVERSAPPVQPEPAASCERCGAALAIDQEWCLECGAARTRIRRAPNWRVPVAVVTVVIALALIAFLIALIDLSIIANR